MTNGADLRDFYIAAWQNVPELVASLANDDPTMIRASGGVAKIGKSLQREVLNMPEGTISVAYQGFKKGHVRLGEIRIHEVAAFIRPLSGIDDEQVNFGILMTDSIPDGFELPVYCLQPTVDILPFGADAVFERVSTAELTVDIWKLTIRLPENT